MVTFSGCKADVIGYWAFAGCLAVVETLAAVGFAAVSEKAGKRSPRAASHIFATTSNGVTK
jgi:hypothetical protein